MAETEQTAQKETATESREEKVEVQNAEYADVGMDAASSGEEHLDLLLEIQLPVMVNLGKTEVPLRRLMQLRPGSVLSLDKRIGQPAELMVQDVPFATGDIVVIDDCFGVKIREILNSDAAAMAVAQQKKN